MIEPERRHRQNIDPSFIDQKGIFIRSMGRAAILDDTQTAGRHLVDDTMIEEDHAVGDVLLKPLARKCSIAAFTSYDRGNAAVLKPPEKPPKLTA